MYAPASPFSRPIPAGDRSMSGLYEARLRQQYTALDASYSKLSGLQSYVSAQLAALNKS